MRIEDAAPLVRNWPEPLTPREKHALMRQLGRIDLPPADVTKWQEETKQKLASQN